MEPPTPYAAFIPHTATLAETWRLREEHLGQLAWEGQRLWQTGLVGQQRRQGKVGVAKSDSYYLISSTQID